MALGTNNMTAGVGGALTADIPLLWGQKINDYFRYNLSLAQFFIDRSEELADGGSDVYTPNIVAMATASKSNGSQVTLNNPIQTKQTLTVSTWKESSFLIEDREMAQLKKSYYLQEKFAKSCAWEVAQDLDDAIAAQFTNFTVAGQILGSGTTNVVDSTLLAAISILETTGVPVYTGETSWIFHPNTFYRQIGSVDKMTLWQNTMTEQPRVKAPTRSLYSIPVIVSPAVPLGAGGAAESGARLNMLAHKDSIHWARMTMPVGRGNVTGFVGSEGVRVQEGYIQEYLGTLITVDLCYGTNQNRTDSAVKIRSHSVASGL